MTKSTTPTTTDLAREIIAEASWEHYEHGEYPAYCDLDELAPEAKRDELARAEAILAALAAKGLRIAGPGHVAVSTASAVAVWNAIWQLVLAGTATAELIEAHKELSGAIGAAALSGADDQPADRPTEGDGE